MKITHCSVSYLPEEIESVNSRLSDFNGGGGFSVSARNEFEIQFARHHRIKDWVTIKLERDYEKYDQESTAMTVSFNLNWFRHILGRKIPSEVMAFANALNDHMCNQGSSEIEGAKFMDASWFEQAIEHYDGASQRDIMPLLGFYFCWAACTDLLSELHLKDLELDIEALKNRDASPLSVIDHIDAKLRDEDFNRRGQLFSAAYLEKRYFEDFTKAFLEETLETYLFDVSDSWENYEKIAPRIDKRFNAWKRRNDINKPRWRFWG